MQQQVRAEEVTIHQVEKEHEVKVQEAEIQRRERELTATVLKPAEPSGSASRPCGSEKQRLIIEAEGMRRPFARRRSGSGNHLQEGEAEAKA